MITNRFKDVTKIESRLLHSLGIISNEGKKGKNYSNFISQNMFKNSSLIDDLLDYRETALKKPLSHEDGVIHNLLLHLSFVSARSLVDEYEILLYSPLTDSQKDLFVSKVMKEFENGGFVAVIKLIKLFINFHRKYPRDNIAKMLTL